MEIMLSCKSHPRCSHGLLRSINIGKGLEIKLNKPKILNVEQN